MFEKCDGGVPDRRGGRATLEGDSGQGLERHCNVEMLMLCNTRVRLAASSTTHRTRFAPLLTSSPPKGVTRDPTATAYFAMASDYYNHSQERTGSPLD
jgi:hypothetical protein